MPYLFWYNYEKISGDQGVMDVAVVNACILSSESESGALQSESKEERGSTKKLQTEAIYYRQRQYRTRLKYWLKFVNTISFSGDKPQTFFGYSWEM